MSLEFACTNLIWLSFQLSFALQLIGLIFSFASILCIQFLSHHIKYLLIISFSVETILQVCKSPFILFQTLPITWSIKSLLVIACIRPISSIWFQISSTSLIQTLESSVVCLKCKFLNCFLRLRSDGVNFGAMQDDSYFWDTLYSCSF